MRTRNQDARHRLPVVLARRAAVPAAELAQQIGVSVPTLHRLLHEQADHVISTGKARRTRYAWRRPLRGDPRKWPLYAVNEAGQAQQVAQLVLVEPQGSCMELAGTAWPVPEDSRDGWWAGLPYPMLDMRPQGFLGRQLARAVHQDLGVASRPDEWGDDDVVHVLSHVGSDLSGNLILGDAAYLRWQALVHGEAESVTAIKARAAGRNYARLAEQALAAGVPGSSTAGEFPKFPALRERAGSSTPHVLVKFSGADGSAAVQRWADLLVCEHLALACAATLPGLASARSHIVVHDGRTILEVERFDRHGLFGRSPLVSLGTLDAAFVGDGSSDWVRLAQRLHALGLLCADVVQHIDHLWWFGRLIANTDMHTGNLSFRPQASAGPLALAPTYDMLPMLYAPLAGGEVPARVFKPALPLPPQRATWATACHAAIQFWLQAAGDSRISAGFRQLCRANAGLLERVVDQV